MQKTKRIVKYIYKPFLYISLGNLSRVYENKYVHTLWLLQSLNFPKAIFFLSPLGGHDSGPEK